MASKKAPSFKTIPAGTAVSRHRHRGPQAWHDGRQHDVLHQRT